MDNDRKMGITDLDADDRPREKMIQRGADALSSAELLAILIGSGSPEENAVSLMQRVLADCKGDLGELSRLGLSGLCRYKGLGTAKSLTILAALELGRRRELQGRGERPTISCSTDIYHLMLPRLRDVPTEEVWVVLMNHAARLIGTTRISQGGIDQAVADVRMIMREALTACATQIALVHNHPSGALQPSQADCRLTDMVAQAAHTLNIRLLDHVIVAGDGGGYYSFSDEGKI